MKVIFICGIRSSGKSTLASALAELHPFQILDTGPHLREHHQHLQNGQTFSEWIQEGEASHGNHFSSNIILETLQKLDPQQPLLVVGFRSQAGIAHIQKNLQAHTLQVFLDVDDQTAARRTGLREGTPLDVSSFQGHLEYERNQGIMETRNHAHLILDSSKPTAHLIQQLQSTLEVFLK